MIRKSLVAAIAALALIGASGNLAPVEDASPSALSLSGTWELKNETGGSTPGLHLALRYPAGLSNWTAPADLAALGIDPARLGGPKAPIAFVIKRDAGTFDCTGQAGNGIGSGEFRFQPSAQYAAEFATLGMKLTLRDQIVAAMADISPDYARGIARLGLMPMSFESFIGLRMFGGSLEELQALRRDFPSADVQAMTAIVMMMRKHLSDVHPIHELFPSATIDDVTAMGMAGVTPDYVEALRDAGVRGLSAASVTGLKTLGVDEVFVKRMVTAGKTGLTVDEVAALKNSGF